MSNAAPDLMPIRDVVGVLQQDFPDVSHSSLRFLEREGLLSPQRTAGGHRLYTGQDVARVRQIKRWQAQRLSLEEIRARLQALEGQPAAALAERLTVELLRGRPHAVPQLMAADDLGVPLAELFQDVLLRVQATVGERWRQGDLRVGQEHEITEIVREAVAQLSWRHATPPQGAPILAACAPGEQHDVGLRMVVGLLRTEGRLVHFLGANVGVDDLLAEIANRRPAVVLLSATLPERFAAIRRLLTALQADPALAAIPVVVGGGMAHAMGADLRALGAIPSEEHDLLRAVDNIVRLSRQTQSHEVATGRMTGERMASR
ncbi:MAG: cobalamin-dependent protein [Thermomicrobiales bacterium]